MAEAKKYPRLFALPRPKLGDQMYRRTLVNQYEEAIVTSLIGNEPGSENWTATLMTKNGVVKSVPALRQHMRSSALLSDAWKNKEYEVRL